MLLAHVLYLHLGQLAELYALLDRLAGVVGVNVHLDDVIVVDHYNAVADGLEERAQRCRVLCAGLLVYDKLGAVRELDILLSRARSRNSRRCGGLRFLLGTYHPAAGDNLLHSAEDNQQTLAARVNYARLFQRREQLRSIRKALFAFFDEFRKEFGSVAALLR